MRRTNLDVVVAVVIAGMNVAWALLGNHIPLIGVTLALPLLFVLPGYMLTEALFHKRSLDVSHRLLFSVGSSLAIDVLSGLILNLLPVGLQAISWATFLGILTALLSLLVVYLRKGVPLNEARSFRFRFSISGFVVLGLAATVAILSFQYAASGVAQQPHTGFTQFWMLPEVQTGKSCAVRLSVRSFEATSVTYHVTMAVNGSQVTPWPQVALAPQQEWDRLVPITSGTANNVYVQAQLYRLNNPEVAYREVHVTLNGCLTSRITPTPKADLVSTYNGTIHDIPANITTKMSLTKVQQNGENIQGYFTVDSGLQGSGTFKGMVTATKQLHFMVTDSTGHATFSFEGGIVSDGNIAGSYCRFDQAKNCTGGYGIWSVAPTSP